MSALETAKTMSVEDVIAKAAASGLREYGVFNDTLVEKWDAIKAEVGTPKRVVAAINNSDTDHAVLALLKTDAANVMEGLAIAAYVLGAEEMILQVPEAESVLAESLQAEADKYGIQIVNAFVNVRMYRDDAIHHIVTMAALAEVLDGSYEGATYLAVKEDGKTGDLKKVSFGTKLGTLIRTEDVKAIELGTVLYTPEEAAELVIDGDLNVGNGVITVLTNKTCLMIEGEKQLQASRENGCGKCTFCREGLNQLDTHMLEITSGKGKKESIDMMKEIGDAMKFSCKCSVGTVGADFTLGTIEKYMSEFDAHIKKRTCPAGVCTCFTTIYIDPNACEGCEECADVCPADCIEGKAGYIHMIDDFDCTKCGKCIEACEYDAVVQTSGRLPKLPSRLVKCGKFKKR